MNRKRFVAACLALVSLTALAQAPDNAPVFSGPPLKLGVIGPFTGPSADFGVPMLNGVRMAVDEINAVGGYLGRRIDLVVQDDKADPPTGLAGAKALAQEKVFATIGFCNTGVAMAALDVFQQNQMPLIVPCAAGSPVTTKFPPADSYVFRTSARDGIQSDFVVADLVKRGWTKVAIFADTTPYGQSGRADVKKALALRKLEPVYEANFALGTTDLTSELRAAREAGANVIFTYTVGKENAAVALSRQALKWNVPLVGGWPLSFPFFIDGAGRAAEGALMAQTFIAEPSNERRAAFLAGYARKYKVRRIPVPMAAAQAYDAAYILLYSMFNIRNGDLSGPRLKAALENMQRTYYGVVATYERPFSPQEKDAIVPTMMVMGQVKDGAITFAYPEDARRNLFVQRKK
ncbi:ABC transporter substrate-binding protein [Ramlibacter rhizophilus]|uniref:ABC transporter substrate-binding protein n=1 Tax=Ramlibacter rhizophilus TaxID=1781167 RepID=A0A4Z0BSJ2_9BURK|nr:ABC transporter substrate-binding protein [Ramlibacter rhizophilus]TFZ01400.1 ABC transporter substrate-binding protein [Ramlibacter rhizophilus]